MDLVTSGSDLASALSETTAEVFLHHHLQVGARVGVMEYTVYYEAYRHHLAVLAGMLRSATQQQSDKLSIPLGKTTRKQKK